MTKRPTTYITSDIRDFVKCCINNWLHLELLPTALFGGLQPTGSHHAESNAITVGGEMAWPSVNGCQR